jgi:hypothetical protein
MLSFCGRGGRYQLSTEAAFTEVHKHEKNDHFIEPMDFPAVRVPRRVLIGGGEADTQQLAATFNGADDEVEFLFTIDEGGGLQLSAKLERVVSRGGCSHGLSSSSVIHET